MTAALWVSMSTTVVVALAGYLATYLTARFTSTRALQQMELQKRIELDHDRLKERDKYSVAFLSAARLVERADPATDPAIIAAALTELRRAAAGLELTAPQLAPDPLYPAVSAVEQLAKARAQAGWPDAITKAETDWTSALATLTTALRELPQTS